MAFSSANIYQLKIFCYMGETAFFFCKRHFLLMKSEWFLLLLLYYNEESFLKNKLELLVMSKPKN
jgi:hypothetical protein